MLINLSNHPHSKWEKEQLLYASVYGGIVEMPFPNIEPELNTEQVEAFARDYLLKCKEEVINKKTDVIHLSGESIFCFLLAQLLLKEGYVCVTSTSERIVIERGNEKISTFRFKQFRNYKLI